jgi:hypothetical protein
MNTEDVVYLLMIISVITNIEGCSKLTCLELCCHILDGPMVDCLSRLVHLQHLHVHPRRLGQALESSFIDGVV